MTQKVYVISVLSIGIILGLLSSNELLSIVMITLILSIMIAFFTIKKPIFPLIVLIIYIPLYSVFRQLSPAIIGHFSLFGAGRDLLIVFILFLALLKLLIRQEKYIVENKAVFFRLYFL